MMPAPLLALLLLSLTLSLLPPPYVTASSSYTTAVNLERSNSSTRSFVIQDNRFVKDGKPFTLRSGSLHYFRVPPAYWEDRMRRMKALGLNSVTMYVAWNFHEEEEGLIHGLGNVTGFLEAAIATDMLVLFRPGPYICGEWEMGGLPAWLLLKTGADGLKLRTYEEQYIAAVDRWWGALMAAAAPYSYSKGGPIAITQIENEYGSFGHCDTNPADAKYMNHLLDLATTHLGAPMTEMLYSTIDGGEGKNAAKLNDGSPWKGDPRVLATVDGSLAPSTGGYAASFVNQKSFNAAGRCPKMWSELWVGWFTVWSDARAANKSGAEFYKGVGEMVRENASFSLYMAHGGTNFGFWSGANGDENTECKPGCIGSGCDCYKPDITSYDYSSPISEGGDHNIGSDGGDLFVAVQQAIAAVPVHPEPHAVPKVAYGTVELTEKAALFDNLETLRTCHASQPWADGKLPSFEDMKSWYGFMYFETTGAGFKQQDLSFDSKTLHDRVQVFVDQKQVGSAYRASCPSNVTAPAGQRMGLLVENMGRINYGASILDYKGLLVAPPVLGHWTASCLPLRSEQVQAVSFHPMSPELQGEAVFSPSTGPTFYRGVLNIGADSKPTDTYLDTAGLTKGLIWVNGHNLGRYWETAGPQHTLYLPGPFLHNGKNEVIVFDLSDCVGESEPCGVSSITSVSRPRYN